MPLFKTKERKKKGIYKKNFVTNILKNSLKPKMIFFSQFCGKISDYNTEKINNLKIKIN